MHKKDFSINSLDWTRRSEARSAMPNPVEPRSAKRRVISSRTHTAIAVTQDPLTSVASAVGDAAKDGTLSEADTAAILKPLELAYNRQPKLREMYATAAHVWLRSSAPATERNLAFLREAIDVFPRDSQLALQIAHVHEKYGQKEHAIRLAEHGLKHAPAGEQGKFRQLLAALKGN